MARQFTASSKDSSFDEEELKAIIEELEEIEAQGVKEIAVKEDLPQLKKIAAEFILVAFEVQEQIRTIELRMAHQKKMRHQIMADLGVTGKFIPSYETEQYKINREELNNMLRSQEVENLYRAAFKFHEDINAILGQEVHTIILLTGAEGEPLLFDLSMEDIFNNKILSYEETSKTSKLNARFRTSAKQLQEVGFQALERDNLGDNLNVKNLNLTYMEVIRRYNNYKSIVMWLFPSNPKTWNRMKVSARGDIAEAYAMFFLKKANYDFMGEGEKNIHYFMIEGVGEVDNVSGLLQGDVTSGKYEYAIKSADASYMSIVQMLPLANKILSGSISTLTDLQKYKEKLASKKSKVRNVLEVVGDKKVDEEADKMITNFQQMLDKK